MNTFSLKEEMGFSDSELRSLLLKAPKLWMKSKCTSSFLQPRYVWKTIMWNGFSHQHSLSPSWKTWMKYLVHDGEGQMMVVMSFVSGSETFILIRT